MDYGFMVASDDQTRMDFCFLGLARLLDQLGCIILCTAFTVLGVAQLLYRHGRVRWIAGQASDGEYLA